MSDAGEPGKDDKIGIVVFNKQGGVWFSSNWNGTKTVEQTLGGGNVVARGSSVGSASGTTTSSVSVVEPIASVYNKFEVKVMNNPSTSYFGVQVLSNTNEVVEINVFDMTGRKVRQYRGSIGETFRIGHSLLQGTYMMEVLQGRNRSVSKLIKD
jgi:hypothetical protein